MANGTQNYSLLTTSGAGAGTWQGNLTNTTQIAPGGVGTYQGSMATVGTLQVTGNFTNSPSGVLTIDVGTIAPTGHDVLVVGGTAHLGGSLFINKVGLAEIPEFVPVNVIAASSYTGNFASFGWNLAGGVIFNPLNGNIQRFSFQSDKPDSTLFGGTKNQTSSWLSLYDDIADPGITNVTWNGTSYTWVAPTTFDSTNPDLLWALSNSLTPGGMNAALMNRLSPEVYVSLSDYAIQATRAHQRTAFDAPAITPSAQPAATGSKDAAPAPAAASPWEVFAATDFFNVNTNNSENNADYGLNSASAMVGARYGVTDRVRIAAYVAGDEGDISGSLINANGSGWSLGLLGEAVLNQAKGTRLTAGVSYGRYTFDGNRGSASATGAGWAPGLVRFSGLDTDAVELSLGIETIAYHTDHFRLLPSAALHYASGSVSAFSETTGAAVGSPIALVVNRINSQSLLAEVSLIGEADVTSKLTLRGQVGLSNEFKDNPRNVSARFALGSRYMTAQAAGLSDDAVFLGFGATYKFTDRISAGLNYRAEFRSGASPYNSVNLGATYGF